MVTLRRTERRYAGAALTVALLIGAPLIFLGYRPVGKGWIMGSLFSVINFIIMAETLTYRISASRKKSTAISFILIFFRFLLLALPIYLAIRFDSLSLPAAVCGLFLVQIIILAENLLIFYRSAGSTNR